MFQYDYFKSFKRICNMKKLFILLFWCFSLVANAQGEFTFVKTLPINGTHYSIESSEYQLELVPTEMKYVKLVVSVYSNFSNEILKQLFIAGRYNIVVNDGVIEFNNIKKHIFVKDTKLTEDIVLKIHVPLGVEISLNVNELLN